MSFCFVKDNNKFKNNHNCRFNYYILIMKLHELESYFKTIDLKKWNNTNLDCGTIINATTFVNSAISTLKANSGKITFLPYYDRLYKFYNLTQENLTLKK